jgi:hypothetical protein
MALRFAIVAVLAISLTGVIRAGDNDKEILEAIKNGQKYLLTNPGGNPGIPGAAIAGIGGNGRGTSCLTGLALIESGLDGTHNKVAALARDARQSAMGTNATYEISLTIMFLDRLGSKDDEGLIQYLTLKLMSGQTRDGGWSYSCDGLQLDPVQARQLAGELVKDGRLSTPETPKSPDKKPKPREDIDLGPKTPKKKEPAETPKEEPKSKLHPALGKIADAIKNGARGGSAISGVDAGCDHSNTQFATVGLWCGRRHGVDVSNALAELDRHYRKCQNNDGGWTYSSYGGSSTPAMSCAGLMGLAMGFGGKDGSKKPDPEAFAGDKVVNDGLKFVGNTIAAAANDRDRGVVPGAAFPMNSISDNMYFMWSLERVGMAYGLKTIGHVDWYEWGSKCLLKSQDRKTGAWQGDGSHGVTAEHATAFAILFLSRANLAEDLATSLKGKIKDPGTSRLRPGNIPDGKTAPKGSDAGTTKPKVDNPAAVELDKVGKLVAALIAAEGAQRAELIAQYRDTKGGEFTDALARAAAKLDGETLTQVRDALAQRLTRMKIETLNEMMRDRDREIRRGAALAVASKGKERLPEFAPVLVRLIADDETIVVQAARASLKSVSGQDFGPEPGANAADRSKAVLAWRTWWDKQKQ